MASPARTTQPRARSSVKPLKRLILSPFFTANYSIGQLRSYQISRKFRLTFAFFSANFRYRSARLRLTCRVIDEEPPRAFTRKVVRIINPQSSSCHREERPKIEENLSS